MWPIEIILPLILLALAFSFKLFIDRSVKLPELFSALLELPADIAFLATSLTIGYTISPQADVKLGLLYFTIYIVAAIIIVALWRRTTALFSSTKYTLCVLLAFLNYIISGYGLMNAIQLSCKILPHVTK